jgi:O-antigen/teichoic acid export membrane protein
VLEQVWINVVAAALWRWIGRGRRPAWLLLSQLMGRALAFPLTLVIARIGGPSLLGRTSIALAFYATGSVVTTAGLAQLATLEGGKAAAVSVGSIRRAAYIHLVGCAPFLAMLGAKLGIDVLVVALMLMAVAVDLDSRCLIGFARGHFRPRYEVTAAVLNGGVPLLGLFLVQVGGTITLRGIAVCFLAGSVAMRAYAAVDVPTAWPDMIQQPEPPKAILKVGAVLSVLSVIVAVQYRLDQFVLGVRWEREVFGIYSAGARLLDVAYALPGSISAFWGIHLQRRMNVGWRRMFALALICAFGGMTLFLALSMLFPLFGAAFGVLDAYRPLFGVYAALMGATVAIMTTAVAITRAGTPTVAMLTSAIVRFVLLSRVASKQSFVSILLVLCATECLTIGIMVLGLYRQSTAGKGITRRQGGGLPREPEESRSA